MLNKQTSGLGTALQASDHLSACIYSTAIHSLWPGPGQAGDIKWLMESRNADGSWGTTHSWQEQYLNSYAAALAFINAGLVDVGRKTLNGLEALVTPSRDYRTLNFGGLIGVLDVYAHAHFKIKMNHPSEVQKQIAKESHKWTLIMQDERFYDPAISIAGFFGESCYSNPDIDLERFVRSFQTTNGSITNSPAASTMCLLAWHERGLATTGRALALQWYVEHLNASVEPIAFVDTLPFQVGIWALLYADDDDGVVPDRPVVEAIRAQLDNAEHLHLVNCTGYSTFPGDLDTTASAVIGLRLTVSQRRGVLEAIEPFFDHDHYKTFLYEHTLSTTTNIHVAAAWPENPRVETVIDWLANQRDSDGFISCKWHASPFYPITELARLFASSPHQKARTLAREAGYLLLATQRRDGGWGFERTTCEETSYAVLALTRLAAYGGMEAARLRTVFDHARPILEATYTRHNPLWVCKTLYSMPPVTRVLQRLALQRLRRLDPLPIQEPGTT